MHVSLTYVALFTFSGIYFSNFDQFCEKSKVVNKRIIDLKFEDERERERELLIV